MSKIYIIGLGPGDINCLTLGALERLNSGYKNILRTEKHPTVSYLKERNIPYISYDFVYEEKENFEQVYNYIVEDLIEKAYKYKVVNYFVPGNPLVAEKAVEILLDCREKKNIELEIITGMSFIDPMLVAVNHDPINGLKILDGLKIEEQKVDINTANIITQVFNKNIASSIKLYISEIYGDEYEVYIINNAGIIGKEKVIKMPIYELDRYDQITDLTSIYIPKVDKINTKIYDINNLLDIMDILRGEGGCPWDIEQSHSSLREYVIEEAYEVLDAIDNGDIDNLEEELGDLLLQVVFHSQIASEAGYFNIIDVTTNVCDKLILRHPHVFKQKKVEKSNEVVYNWDEIKFKDRKIENYTGRLKDIPKLPSLMRSYKVQKRAADIGFDWDDIYGTIDKVEEEYFEVIEALNLCKGGDMEKVEEEIGDLLFSVVNMCRFSKVNPEIALNKAINKFIKRFEKMEIKSNELGKDLKSMTLDEMDALWDEIKNT